MRVNYKFSGTGPSPGTKRTRDVDLGKASNPEPAEQSEFPNTKLTGRLLSQLNEACDTQNWDFAAQLLGELAEFTRAIPVGVLPMGILANIVGQMQAVLSEPSPFPPHALALALCLELQSAAEMETQAPSPVLVAVHHVLGQQDLLLRLVHDPEIAAALAAALGRFSECVGTLPPDAGDSIIARLAGFFDAAIGQHPANVILAPEIFHVLYAFAARGYPYHGLPELILACLGQFLQQPDPGPFATPTPTLISLVQSDDEQVASALTAILKHFSGCVGKLPSDTAGIDEIIPRMQQLFDLTCEPPGREGIALEALHVAALLAIKTNAVSVALEVMLRLSSMPTANFAFENRCIAADILKISIGVL